MKTRLLATACLLLGFAPGAIAYDCIEVFLFEVDRDNFSTKEYERAAATPEEFLEFFQHSTIGELIRSENGLTAVKAQEEQCPEDSVALQMGGQVTDYKAGNQAMRYWVGFGAGKQKLAVNAWLRDKSSQEVIYEDRIVDRKWAGWGGGDDRKGARDFAEKVDKFVVQGMQKSP